MTSILLLGLLAVLCRGTHAASLKSGWSGQSALRSGASSPSFCHDLDCPPYTSVRDIAKDVELRSYDAGAWVSTNVKGSSYDVAVSKGFMRLFAYISGANEEKAKIDMTCPVRVLVTPGQGPFCEDHFKISFYVPFAHQDAPPLPSSSDVFVETDAATDVYVLSYGGRTDERQVLARAQELAGVLDAAGLEGAYEADTFYSAGYDSPFRIFNRHNEIWMVAKAA